MSLRRDGLTRLRVIDPSTGDGRELGFDDPVSTVGPGTNAVFDTSTYRFAYQSLTTPASVYDEDLATGERILRKRLPVLGDFDPAQYTSERQWAEAVTSEATHIIRIRRTKTLGSNMRFTEGTRIFEIRSVIEDGPHWTDCLCREKPLPPLTQPS